MEYAIINGSGSNYNKCIVQLVKVTNEKIEEGYKPFGSLSVVERAGEFYFSQPIVKEE